MPNDFRYYAFISYKREDEKWAKWLQRKLENYRLPTSLCKQYSHLPKKLKPIFRDKTDLKTGFLNEELRNELEHSRYLIVICSPKAAQSEWVGKEIEAFIEMGRSHCIIPFIIEGAPYTNDAATECFHPILKTHLPELLGVNLNEAGSGSRRIKREKAFIRVVSKMLDVTFDTLWQRQRRRMIRNTMLSCLALLLVACIVGYVWKSNQPFDVEVRLKEVTEHNEHLPFENGRVGLCYNHDTLYSKPIHEYDDKVVFKNIPGKFYGKQAEIWFEMQGFEKASDCLIFEKNMVLPIMRDSTYQFFRGRISDGILNNGDFTGVEDVCVYITDINLSTQTDSNGYFQIEIPNYFQRSSYNIIISKNGYEHKQYYDTPIVCSVKWDMVINKIN